MGSSSGTRLAALDSGRTSGVRGAAPGAALALGALALVVLAWRVAEIRPSLLFSPANAATLWRFGTALFPPDFSPDFLRTVWRAVVQTVAMAAAGTLLSVIAAVPLAVVATSTLWIRGVLTDAADRSAWFSFLFAANRLTRGSLGFLRAVPDLVWALVFVVAVGLGPLPGTLALAVAYTGVLGRVYADVFEHVPSGPLEALQGAGASRLQIFLFGIWPQARAHVTAYTLYSFECCVRAASVLGFVGAGGIGYEISVSMRLFEYGQVLTLLLVLVVLLAITDWGSRRLRQRVTSNAKHHESRLGSQVLLWIAPIMVLALSFRFAGFYGSDAASYGGGVTRIVGFLGNMMPPDFSPGFLRVVVVASLQTLSIAVIGTLSGILLGSALAIPATSSFVLRDREAAGRHMLAGTLARNLLYGSSRLILNLLRSIPELVWVLILVLAVGFGPFAGTLALALHTAGVLGKLYAETMEEVSPKPVEALRSVGASPFQVVVWAIWPQAKPMLSSYSVLRWETNLRASTILGLVGGGGLGQAIYNDVQLGFYSRLSTLILVTCLLVLASDWIGERLRVSIA